MGFAPLMGKRVSLRPMRHEDVDAIERWYGEAAQAAFEDRSLEELPSLASSETACVLAVERVGEDEAIGLVEYETRDGWLAVPFIALAKHYRGWGYGSEAVRLLEDWALRQGGAKRFRGDVDVRNGLGLYFWLRLGYRPADSVLGDTFVMIRTS